MKIGIHSYYDAFNRGNAVFAPETYGLGENMEYPFVALKTKLLQIGNELDTLDIHGLDAYEKILFLDLPDPNVISLEDLQRAGKELYLIILESEIIRPENMNKKYHACFKKVFTWNDDLVDNEKYIKLNISHKIPHVDHFDVSCKKKLCAIIAGNKQCMDRRELYSERLKAIRWFEKKHPEDFDLYGIGWDRPASRNKILLRAMNGSRVVARIFSKKLKSYRGAVASKQSILSKYFFSICYENARDLKGYITEKLFDSFFAGCVPVYLGAPNVNKLIPRDTYIDRGAFQSYEDLFKFLKNMSSDTYCKYLANIKDFLNGPKSYLFSGEHFAELVTENILH